MRHYRARSAMTNEDARIWTQICKGNKLFWATLLTNSIRRDNADFRLMKALNTRQGSPL